MWFGEPNPFPERWSPTKLRTSGQQSYKGWSCRTPALSAKYKDCSLLVRDAVWHDRYTSTFLLRFWWQGFIRRQHTATRLQAKNGVGRPDRGPHFVNLWPRLNSFVDLTLEWCLLHSYENREKERRLRMLRMKRKKGRDRIMLSNGEVGKYGHLIDTCDR